MTSTSSYFSLTHSLAHSLAHSLTHSLTPLLVATNQPTRYVIIASDGVWEFLTSQAVADLVAKFEDPLDACRAVVTESYELWLQVLTYVTH